MKKVNIFLAVLILFGVMLTGYGSITLYRGQRGLITHRESLRILEHIERSGPMSKPKDFNDWPSDTQEIYINAYINQAVKISSKQQSNTNSLNGLIMIVLGAGVIVAIFLFKKFLSK